MDKNRTDLLAAGRKKLQQFRKKKGGARRGPGAAADNDRQDADAAGSQRCNGAAPVVTDGADGEPCNGDGLEDASVQVVESAMSEVSVSGSSTGRSALQSLEGVSDAAEVGHGEGTGTPSSCVGLPAENVSDQAVGSASVEVSVSGVREFREEEGTVDTTSSSSTMVEGERARDPVSDAAEVGHREETGAPSSRVELIAENGDTEHVECEQTEAGTSDLNERAHQETTLSVPVKVTQDADLDDSGKHVEVSSSTQESNVASAASEVGTEVSISRIREAREEEGSLDTTPSSSMTVKGRSALQSLERVPDAAEVGHREGTGTPSSHVDLLAENGDTSELTETGTSGLNEEMAQRSQQETVLSIPVEVTQDADLTDSGEHVEVSSSTQESLGEYGCHIDYVKEGGGVSVGEDAVVDSVFVGNILGGPVSPKAEMVQEEDSLFTLGASDDRLESLRSHLYLANIEKDVLELQLAEQVELNADYYQRSSDEVSKLLGLVKEAHESKDCVSEELVHCRSELQAAALENKKLENRCSLMKEEIDQFHNRASELETKLEHSQEERSRVSDELSNCRFLMEVLQKENLDLASRLASETDARKKLGEENTRLAAELLEQKELLLTALNKQTQLEGDLRETGACFEEFAMENLHLSSNVVVYEAKIKELDGYHFELPIQPREEVPRSNPSNMEGVSTDNANDDSHITSNGDGNHGIDVVPDTAGNSIAIQEEEGVVTGSSDALGLLKVHLEEVKNILDNLDKSVQNMHSHTVSLSRSVGRAAAPGVSKLIKAFEFKTHPVDEASEVVPVTEGGLSEDPYIPVSREVSNLKDSLKLMELDIEMVEGQLKVDCNTRIICEQLETECEAHRQQNNILRANISDLVQKLSNYMSRTDDLQNCLNEIQRSANYQSETFLSQVELLQKEVNDNTSIVNQERASFTSVILGAVERLNASTGHPPLENTDAGSTVLAAVHAATTTLKSLHEQLEASHLNYNTLSASCEEMNRLYTDIQGRKDYAVSLLNKCYRSLRELVIDSCQIVGEAQAGETEELLAENYEKIFEHLQVLMDERLHLLSTSSKLESELSNRNQEADDLNLRCKNLVNELEDLRHANDRLESALVNKTYGNDEFGKRCLALMQKLEEHVYSEDLETIPGLAEHRAVVDNTENDFSNTLLFRLEALVAFHIQKYEGAIEQINLSKNYLRGICKSSEVSASSWSSPLLTFLQQEIVPYVLELQENLQLSSASNLQLENEMFILRESLRKMDEAFKVAQSELHSKSSELEQAEQRVASVREKLSIAVAKGKGLIVQRDSLKQSLTEKSNDLEKCTQELMSKEAMLHEAEAKLKSYSEVDRVEALESELSYIRNSATALRDSFLLKDSVLQRIEEVLEDLDLPEHFHSKDIIEKIELLAKSVMDSSSFSMTDWDQKSSAGISHSDAGFVGMDAWKDELPPSSNPEFDEFKRKHDELQNKLYGLAEHNDMLEQSLLERDNLLQKWEEVLNGVDVPSQLRSLDPEDRIEWLKRAFAEVQQERDSLLLKIENLEVSSDMLIVDLEESHKKISELSAEVVAVKSEKEFFSESLGKLRYEYLGLSEKAVHDEIDNENLRRELDELQEKLVKNSESKEHDVDKEMWRLHDLVVSGLPDHDRFETLSGGSGTECLERLLKNLMDHYVTLQTEISIQKDREEEFVAEERNLPLDKTELDAIAEDKYQELVALKLELEEASRNMILLKEERENVMEKLQSLMLETETVSIQRNLLQEERIKDAEKYQTLEFELATIIKQRDTLQEQLAEQEQKSAAVENMLLEIDAMRYRQSLLQEEKTKDTEKYQNLAMEFEATVKQRDALQEQLAEQEQKSVALENLLLEIDTMRNQQSVLQEEKTKDTEKYQNLALEFEATVKQRDALQEQLAEQKQKSVALENLLLEIDTMRNQQSLLQEEKTKDTEKYQNLALEFEAIVKQRDALQDQLEQEAQKSASAREKLNVAVRKGKGLVQQRDSLKQTIEEMNTAIQHLKMEQSQQVEALESEKSLLLNRLTEIEHSFRDNSQNLSRLLSALEFIDVGSEVQVIDPVQKIELIGKSCNDLRLALVSCEHEANKSRGTVELLLAELTEVQERSDALQEELTKAIAAKNHALSRLEHFMLFHSEERKKQLDSLARLESSIYELKKSGFEFCNLLSSVHTKDRDILCNMGAFLESTLKQMDGENNAVHVHVSSGLISNNPVCEGRFLSLETDSVPSMHEQCDESSITEHLALANSSVHECIAEFDDVKESMHKHSVYVDQQATNLLNAMQTVQRKLASQTEYSESLKRDAAGLELIIKEKETDIRKAQRKVGMLYEACSSAIVEIENREGLLGKSIPFQDHVFRKSGMVLKLPSDADGQDHTDGQNFILNDDCVRMVAETLISTLKGSNNTSEMAEANQRELKATIADLQNKLHERDIQINTISTDLVSQIREAESVAKRSVMDLDSARSQILTLEKQIELMVDDRKVLESRVNELKDWEASSNKLQERIKTLGDTLSAKDQEIEALMQALDEEESQMEGLEDRNRQLENLVQERNLKLESLEASQSRTLSKLSTTMSKFDELHNLSESFLAEIENLQSQLQGRDSEISFLRQEVTRCTNDILASQETNNRHSYDAQELLKWMDTMASRCGAPRVHLSDQEGRQVREYSEILEKKVASIMTELDDLRMKAESKEALLQIERGRVEELSCKTEVLESSLREKETLIELSEGRTDSVQQASSSSSGSLEIEEVRDKVILGPVKTHVRGSRKVNSDHIAIVVDPEKDDTLLEDEDDDKAHGFKSLTMSRIVPRASRPVADRIDGIWVSGERLLMRQPSLRLGVILYWIALHILLASAI